MPRSYPTFREQFQEELEERFSYQEQEVYTAVENSCSHLLENDLLCEGIQLYQSVILYAFPKQLNQNLIKQILRDRGEVELDHETDTHFIYRLTITGDKRVDIISPDEVLDERVKEQINHFLHRDKTNTHITFISYPKGKDINSECSLVISAPIGTYAPLEWGTDKIIYKLLEDLHKANIDEYPVKRPETLVEAAKDYDITLILTNSNPESKLLITNKQLLG